MYSKFGQFIDGKWTSSEKQETYEVVNPATEEIIGKASKAGSEDVKKALNSGEKGFALLIGSFFLKEKFTLLKTAAVLTIFFGVILLKFF